MATEADGQELTRWKIHGERVSLRDEVHQTLDSMLERERLDRTVRLHVTTADIVIFGALLAQRLPHVEE